MRFCCLGSGSRGNAAVVEHGDTSVLVDCGFSSSSLKSRLLRAGFSSLPVLPQHAVSLTSRAPPLHVPELNAILITHEHSDHITALPNLEAAGAKIHMTAGTAKALNFTGAHILKPGEWFSLGDLQILPLVVPHDAGEPVQFIFGDGARLFAMLTDLGHITPAIYSACAELDAVMIECNYAADLLAANSRYPPQVKSRISGKYGHLSNDEAAAFISCLESPRLRHVVAAHLSANNNTEARVRRCMEAVCSPKKVTVASQKNGTDWIAIGD